jgi:iron complex outermembrane receptor protein
MHRPFTLSPLTLAMRPLLSVALITPLSLISAFSYAAEETTLPTITVTANAETATTPVKGYVAKRTTAGTKTDTPLNEVPQSISIVTKDQIKDQGIQSIAEALRYSAGVTADPYGVDNRGEYFTIRGASEASVVLDGLRQPLVGWWGSLKDEPYSLERVEVIRGPAAVTYGQNPPGGLVNLVTKKPQATAAREVNVQYGNYNFKQAAFDFTGPIDQEQKVLYRLVGLKKDSGTQVQYANNKRDFLHAGLTYLPADGTSLTVYGQYQHDESQNTNAFLPWAGTLKPAKAGLPQVSSKLFVGEPEWDSYGGDRKRFGYAIEQQLSDHWQVRHNLRYDDVQGDYRYAYLDCCGWSDQIIPEADQGKKFYRFFDMGKPTSNTVNTDIQLEGKLNFDNIEHTLFAGADFARARSTNPTAGTLASKNGVPVPFDVYNPVYGQVDEVFLEDFASPDAYTPTIDQQFGLAFQDQVKFFDRVVLLAGVRYDQVKSKKKNSAASEYDESAWSKRFGLVYLGDYGLSPFVSYSESFKAQSAIDLNRNTLKPTSGEQYELGLKWLPTNDFSVLASLYHITEKDRAVSNSATPETYDSIALGEMTSKGAEIEVKGKLPVLGTDVIASYSYADVADTSPNANEIQFESIPKHLASLWAKQNFNLAGVEGFSAGAGVRYLGKNWGNSGDKAVVSVPDVTLIDAMLGFEQPSWSFILSAKNLTDKDYMATCLGRGDCWFGARRTVIGSATYKW